MTKEKFMIRAYGKSEFALLMFPTIDDPKVAQAKLLRWIKKDKQFHQSLVGMGLSSHDKDYSPGREVTSSPPDSGGEEVTKGRQLRA
jgi:hypothetical protein